MTGMGLASTLPLTLTLTLGAPLGTLLKRGEGAIMKLQRQSLCIACRERQERNASSPYEGVAKDKAEMPPLPLGED